MPKDMTRGELQGLLGRGLLVATPGGALVGLLRREDAERAGEDAS